MIIAKEDIMVLLNEFYLNGKYRISVSAPMIGEMYRFELGRAPALHMLTLDEYYERYSSACLEAEREVAGEVPDHSEYRRVLQSSGVLKPENYTEVLRVLEEESDRNFMRGDRPLYIGFDTNAIISRFPVIMPEVKCGFCLSSGIMKELHPEFIEEKIGKNKANLLRKCGMGELFNQPVMRARKFRLGAVEYRKLMNREYAEEVEGDKGDLSIVESYSRFQRSKNADLILISEDAGFVEVASDYRIKAVHLVQAKEVPKRADVTWEELAELLYVTAVVYGRIRVRSVSMCGVWMGKSGDDWNSERVRLEFEDRELRERMERDMRILRVCELT